MEAIRENPAARVTGFPRSGRGRGRSGLFDDLDHPMGAPIDQNRLIVDDGVTILGHAVFLRPVEIGHAAARHWRSVFARTAGFTVAQAPFRQRRGHRHEPGSAPLAHPGRTQRSLGFHSQTRN